MSIKQQVFDWLEKNPRTSTLNNLFRVFESLAKKPYLRQLYIQYIKRNDPEERYCRFCSTMKPNSEILIIDQLIGRFSKIYCCKDCLENNEKTKKLRIYPRQEIKELSGK